jgi:hypothetical protein
MEPYTVDYPEAPISDVPAVNDVLVVERCPLVCVVHILPLDVYEPPLKMWIKG